MAAAASMALIVMIALAIMFASGIFLIIFSRRSRGLGFPACGACQYDLSGSVGSVARCPECGADFKTVGITPPAGKRSKSMLVTGLVLLILPLTCAGMLFVSLLISGARSQQTIVVAPAPALPPTTDPAVPVMPGVMPSAPQVADDAEIDTTE